MSSEMAAVKTGAIDQKGHLQAIGGVNEKIEGFFETCRDLGLTGSQGVIIPKSNVGDLMLRQDVLDAVAAGQFHVWAVEHVDQGMELLLGKPAGMHDAEGQHPEDSVHGRVEEALVHMGEVLKQYEHPEEEHKPEDEEEDEAAPTEEPDPTRDRVPPMRDAPDPDEDGDGDDEGE